jgi:hypothetical protein
MRDTGADSAGLGRRPHAFDTQGARRKRKLDPDFLGEVHDL